MEPLLYQRLSLAVSGPNPIGPGPGPLGPSINPFGPYKDHSAPLLDRFSQVLGLLELHWKHGPISQATVQPKKP